MKHTWNTMECERERERERELQWRSRRSKRDTPDVFHIALRTQSVTAHACASSVHGDIVTSLVLSESAVRARTSSVTRSRVFRDLPDASDSKASMKNFTILAQWKLSAGQIIFAFRTKSFDRLPIKIDPSEKMTVPHDKIWKTKYKISHSVLNFLQFKYNSSQVLEK